MREIRAAGIATLDGIASALNALPRNLAVTVSEAVKANKFSS